MPANTPTCLGCARRVRSLVACAAAAAAVLAAPAAASAPTWQWTSQRGTPSGDYLGALALNAEGDAFLAGNTFGNIERNTSSSDVDVFIMKISRDGRHEWSLQQGSPRDDHFGAMALTRQGDALVAGVTHGNLDGNTRAGHDKDLFVAKITSAGAWPWTLQVGSEMDEQVLALAVSDAGNVVVAGYTLGGLDGNSNAGGQDLFLMSISADGVAQWTFQHGSSVDDHVSALALNAQGDAFVAGFSAGNLGRGADSSGDENVYLMRIASSGELSWTVQRGHTIGDYRLHLALDTDGDAFVAGVTDRNVDGEHLEVFVTKISADGAWQWTAQRGLGTPGVGGPRGLAARGIAVTPAGDVVIAGNTFGDLDADEATGDDQDVFLMMAGRTGAWKWATQLGTPRREHATSLVLDAEGSMFVAGETYGSLDGSTTGGRRDIFLAKLSYQGARQWTVQRGAAEAADYARALALDGRGDAVVAGFTSGGVDGHTQAGRHDVFVMKIAAAGSEGGEWRPENARAMALRGVVSAGAAVRTYMSVAGSALAIVLACLSSSVA